MTASAEPPGRPDVPRWLEWVRALQGIAQSGLTYARDPYDVERYLDVRRVAAEIAADRSAGDLESIEGLFASALGYPTPKIDVRSAVIVEDRILLVQERDDGGWALPGGWADVGESAARAAVRETREEAGLEVRAVKLIALYDRERHGHPPHAEHSYKVVFACELCGAPAPGGGPESGGARGPDGGPESRGIPELRAGADMQGAGFFHSGELPPLSLARVTPEQIAAAFAHQADPELPTEFD